MSITESSTCKGGLLTYNNCIECGFFGCSICDPGYYVSLTVCYVCDEHCLECKYTKECSRCSADTFYLNKKCNLFPENCEKTDITTGKCDLCNSGYYINEQGLCSLCNSTMPINSECQCSTIKISNCAECNGVECKICREASKNVNGLCLLDKCMETKDCPSSQYCQINDANINICANCPEGCKSCESDSKCSACQSGFTLINEVCEACSASSPVDSVCVCGNSSFSNCGACLDNDCGSCIDGFVKNPHGECSTCDGLSGVCTCGSVEVSNCLGCSESKCSSCSKGYKLLGGQCLKNECDDEVPCQQSEFCKVSDDMENKCTSCPVNCNTCSNGETCDLCDNDHFSDQNECKPCSANIAGKCICDGKPSFGCTKCGAEGCETCSSDKYFLLNGKCITKCMEQKDCEEGQFCNIEAHGMNTCFVCGPNCAKCSSATKCDLCENGTFEAGGQCKNCSGIPSDQSCQCGSQLIQNCQQCGISQNCIKCPEKYALLDNKCFLKECDTIMPCETAQFCSDKFTCDQCSDGCDNCSSTTSCSQCKSGWQMENSVCIDCKTYPNKCQKQANKTNTVAIIAGVVTGVIVIIVLIVIAVLIFIKRRNSKKAELVRDKPLITESESNSSVSTKFYI